MGLVVQIILRVLLGIHHMCKQYVIKRSIMRNHFVNNLLRVIDQVGVSGIMICKNLSVLIENADVEHKRFFQIILAFQEILHQMNIYFVSFFMFVEFHGEKVDRIHSRKVYQKHRSHNTEEHDVFWFDIRHVGVDGRAFVHVRQVGERHCFS